MHLPIYNVTFASITSINKMWIAILESKFQSYFARKF